MNKSNLSTGEWTSQTRKTTISLAKWTSAWVLTMALATFGSLLLWESTLLTISAILINLGIGIGMIISNIRHLAATDEMMQKVQLEAMGISLGVGIVGGLSYSLLDTTNLISFNAEISHVVMLFAFAYLIAIFIGMRKLR